MAGAGSCAGHTQGGSCWTRWQQLQGSCRTGSCQQWPRQMALLVLSVQENSLGLSPASSQPAVPTPAPCGLATVSDCPQVPKPAPQLTPNLSSFPLSLFKSLHSLSPKPPHSLPCSFSPFFLAFVFYFFFLLTSSLFGFFLGPFLQPAGAFQLRTLGSRTGSTAAVTLGTSMDSHSRHLSALTPRFRLAQLSSCTPGFCQLP